MTFYLNLSLCCYSLGSVSVLAKKWVHIMAVITGKIFYITLHTLLYILKIIIIKTFLDCEQLKSMSYQLSSQPPEGFIDVPESLQYT